MRLPTLALGVIVVVIVMVAVLMLFALVLQLLRLMRRQVLVGGAANELVRGLRRAQLQRTRLKSLYTTQVSTFFSRQRLTAYSMLNVLLTAFGAQADSGIQYLAPGPIETSETTIVALV